MSLFYFKFYKLIDRINPIDGLRISVWYENEKSFFMPSLFQKVIKEDDYYNIEVKLLESERFSSRVYIGKKFYFGTPNYVIGYGILEEIK
jgi:hypothetical protein